LIDFAIKDLKLNFVFWGYFDRHKSGDLSFAKDVISGSMPMAKAYPLSDRQS
jgi:hypothetical protein